MASRAYQKCLGMDKDYFPLPTDDPYNENDDHSDDYSDAGEGKDLLEEKDFTKSPSCAIQ